MDNTFDTELEEYKRNIVDKSLFYGLCLGTLNYCIGYYPFRWPPEDFTFLVESLLLITILVTYIFRHQLKPKTRGLILLLVIYGFVISAAILLGTNSINRLLVVIIPVYALLIFSMKEAILFFSFTLISYVSVGILHQTGALDTIASDKREIDIEQWVISTLMMILVVTVVMQLTVQYTKSYRHLIARLKSQNLSLIDNKKVLEDEKTYVNHLLDNLPGLFNLFKKEGDKFKLVRWNKNSQDIYGATTEQMRSFGPLDMIHPKDLQKISDLLVDIEKGIGQPTEARINNSEQRKLWFQLQGYPFEHNNEKFFIGIGIDITREKITSQLLHQEMLFNDKVLNTFPGTFYLYELVNKRYSLMRWNKNFEMETGYSAQELRGKHPLDFFPRDYHKIIESSFEGLKDNHHVSIEAPILSKNGAGDYWHFENKTFKNRGKHYLIGFGIDISERKMMERELEHRNMNLRDMLHDLQNRNTKLAEYAFINSHLLRAPLARILGLADLVTKQVILSEDQELLANFKTSARELDAIISKINEVLDHRKDLDRNEILNMLTKFQQSEEKLK